MARERMHQVKVGMDVLLRTRLEGLAKKSGRSLAEEIRRLLENALWDEETFDEPTRWLAHNICHLANDVRAVSGVAWHQHPAARAVLAEAIAAWLEGEGRPGLAPLSAPELEKPDYNPRNVGRTIAHMRRRPIGTTGDSAVLLRDIDAVVREYGLDEVQKPRRTAKKTKKPRAK